MDPKFEEGWFTDPYGRHEARWMSAGEPTALIRDGGTEGNDPPPDEPRSFAAEPVEVESTRRGGEELRRIDDGTVERGSGVGRIFDAESGEIASLSLGRRKR